MLRRPAKKDSRGANMSVTVSEKIRILINETINNINRYLEEYSSIIESTEIPPTLEASIKSDIKILSEVYKSQLNIFNYLKQEYKKLFNREYEENLNKIDEEISKIAEIKDDEINLKKDILFKIIYNLNITASKALENMDIINRLYLIIISIFTEYLKMKMEAEKEYFDIVEQTINTETGEISEKILYTNVEGREADKIIERLNLLYSIEAGNKRRTVYKVKREREVELYH
jgi:hypothetical protein